MSSKEIEISGVVYSAWSGGATVSFREIGVVQTLEGDAADGLELGDQLVIRLPFAVQKKGANDE